MTTFLDTDPEIQEAMDELDEGEIALIDESGSTLLFDQNFSEDWFYTIKEDQDPVAEEQEPVEEEHDPGGRGLVSEFFPASKDGSWTFQNTMPRKGKDQTFDKLVIQLGLQENRK